MSNLPSSTRAEHAVIHETLDRAEVLHVFGEVDIFTAPELESAIAGSVRIGRFLVVNLLECRYIDSTVIALLMRAQKALGDRLRIVTPKSGTVPRVLRLTEVDRVLRISNTLVDALRS
jgi:anti-anti-sigma factor